MGVDEIDEIIRSTDVILGDPESGENVDKLVDELETHIRKTPQSPLMDLHQKNLRKYKTSQRLAKQEKNARNN